MGILKEPAKNKAKPLLPKDLLVDLVSAEEEQGGADARIRENLEISLGKKKDARLYDTGDPLGVSNQTERRHTWVGTSSMVTSALLTTEDIRRVARSLSKRGDF